VTRAANRKESTMTQEQKVISAKVGMLELARQLGKMSARPAAGAVTLPRWSSKIA
jgi:hypothetical protein